MVAFLQNTQALQVSFRLLLHSFCTILVCSVSSLSAYGAEKWPVEYVAQPFFFHADFSLQQEPGLIDDLRQLEDDLVRELEVPRSQEMIHIYLFAKKSTYQQYLKRYFPKIPFRRALFVKGKGPGMVFAYRSRDFRVDLRHEATHALLHASLPMVPLWLDEGLAEYFEVSPEKRASKNPHLKAFRWNLRFGMVPDLARLEQTPSLNEMGKSEYRHAWSWAHFMLLGPPAAHDELVQFLSDIRSHTPPGRLSRRLARRLPELKDSFKEHFKRW